MNNNYKVLFFFLLFSCINIPQINKSSLLDSVKIIDCQIKFIETVVAYKPGNTRVYPPTKIPFNQNHYRCNIEIKLIGDNFIIRSPIKLKCFFANGKVITKLIYHEKEFLLGGISYNFEFDIKTEDSLRGQTKIELIKYDPNKNEDEFDSKNLFDKVTLFVN